VRDQLDELQSMNMSLISTRRFKGFYVVDKVFELENLLQSTTQNDLPSAFVSDYSKSVLEVYRVATLHFIEDMVH
jgi:hypothetical protein